MNDPTGSQWRIWDLHVHTPDSVVQAYGGSSKGSWERWIADVEQLPPSFKVLGVNDYLFIDGYRKVLEAKSRGRLKNIELVLPVVELRLDKFGGSDTKLSRVNYHVLFSDSIAPDVIEQQFIKALSKSYKLMPGLDGVQWSGAITREAIEDLGKQLIAAVPTEQKANFGSALFEGFRNLNVSLEGIQERLNSPYFKGKCITAVGKTEWWDIRWNDKSIAEKKNIINSADLVFIACDEPSEYAKARNSLTAAQVNDRLLDCSDAHDYSSSKSKDRIGNCMTWLKADPTFEGLRHVVVEPYERVYVGPKPAQISNVEGNRTKYIRAVKIRKVQSQGKPLDEKWFNASVTMNHGLVAVIGNKGNGKSALVDVIGLLGNSKNEHWFSFLNDEKFRKLPTNRAQFFEGALEWESDETARMRLDHHVDPEGVERVKYLPQNYYELVCTQIESIEETEFDKELKGVIFSHVGSAERLGQADLGDLIRFKTGDIGQRISKTRLKLDQLNAEIVALEARLTPEYRKTLRNQLAAKKQELAAYDRSKPSRVRKPTKKASDLEEKLRGSEASVTSLENKIADSESQLEELVEAMAQAERAKTKVETFQEEYDSFIDGLNEMLAGLDLSAEDVVRLEVDTRLLDTKLAAMKRRKKRLRDSLSKALKTGLKAKHAEAVVKSKELRDKLDRPSREYEEYRERLRKWEEGRKRIVGGPKTLGTLTNLQKHPEELSNLPERRTQLTEKRRTYAGKIHRDLIRVRDVQAELYGPVTRFIDEHPDLRDKIDLNFASSIRNVGVEERFLEWINQAKSGSFMGAEGRRLVAGLVAKRDFNKEDEALALADEVIDHLRINKSAQPNQEIQISEQLRKGKTVQSLYTFLYSFEYLEPRYALRLGEKELRELSPGERGALLIVFYLLVDLNTLPLIIDQPEHNLDNETVTKLLVPAIRKAKARRQIILVTHNPILAVVCNADQVIGANLDVGDGHRIEYLSGAIENPSMNRKIVDVLEGTMIAFDNRQKKYIRELVQAYQEAAWG